MAAKDESTPLTLQSMGDCEGITAGITLLLQAGWCETVAQVESITELIAGEFRCVVGRWCSCQPSACVWVSTEAMLLHDSAATL